MVATHMNCYYDVVKTENLRDTVEHAIIYFPYPPLPHCEVSSMW